MKSKLGLMLLAVLFGAQLNAAEFRTADNLTYLVSLSDKLTDAERAVVATQIEQVGNQYGNGTYDYLDILYVVIVNLTGHGLKLVQQMPGVVAVELERQVQGFPRTGRSNAAVPDCDIQLRPPGSDIE